MDAPWLEPAPPLGGREPGALADAARAAVHDAGVTFGALGDERFHLDPIPRVIEAAEWSSLAAGLGQRLRALDAWCADCYGARRIVADGVVPARVIDTCEWFEPELAGVHLPLWAGIAGLDVVRGADGRFRVLEDNLRMPSGMAYAVVARETTLRLLEPADPPLPLDDLPSLLAGTLAAANGGDPPRAAVLTDGPHNAAHWEHGWLARALGIPLVEPDELDLSVVDVVYRRTDDDRVDSPVGRLLSGRVAVVNAFGVGVGDDKLAHAYVEDMVRYYLGEEPLVPSVRTYDLAVPEVLEEALDRLAELVIKPRSGFGGEGVVIAPHAEAADVERLRRAVRQSPGDYIAQELVVLSCHQTVIDGELAPRHVDLRPFAFLDADGNASVLPGGLTRVAFDEGALVVNSSQNGGAKDTWVV